MEVPRWSDEHLSREPDDGLMARVRAGDESALDALIQRFWSPLIRYAVRFVHDVPTAEDLVQETFVQVWERRERWSCEGSVRGFLYTVLRNRCLHERDRRRVREEWATRERPGASYRQTPFDMLQEREVALALERALQELPERRREVFELVCLHGLSYRETATSMGVAVPTVANQLSSALSHLRAALRDVSG